MMKGVITKLFRKPSLFLKCVIWNVLFGSIICLSKKIFSSVEGFSINAVKVNYYYMDGCGHCETFSPIWDEFTSSYKGPLQFQKINMKDAEDDLKKYEIDGFPTVVLIDETGNYEHYQGERTISGLQSI